MTNKKLESAVDEDSKQINISGIDVTCYMPDEIGRNGSVHLPGIHHLDYCISFTYWDVPIEAIKNGMDEYHAQMFEAAKAHVKGHRTDNRAICSISQSIIHKDEKIVSGYGLVLAAAGAGYGYDEPPRYEEGSDNTIPIAKKSAIEQRELVFKEVIEDLKSKSLLGNPAELVTWSTLIHEVVGTFYPGV